MRILVTGGAGLIGSHLSDELLERDHKVDVIDNLSFGKIQNLHRSKEFEHFKFINDDVLNLEEIDEKYDVIFHLASLKKAWTNDSITSTDILEVNYEMTKNVVKKCIRDGSKLIFTSTSDIYGNSSNFSEDSDITMGPPTHHRYSYALSKWHSEQYVMNAIKDNNLQAGIARVFGCASKRSNMTWSGGHVPLFAHLASQHKDIIIHGDGNQTRSISHAKDIATGLVRILERFEVASNQIINLGTDQQTTVKYVAQYLIDQLSSRSKIIYHQDFHKGYNEILVRYANTEKAKKLLNFSISYTTEQVIDEIAHHFKHSVNV